MSEIKIYCPGCTNHCQYPNACCVIGMMNFSKITPPDNKTEKTDIAEEKK